MALPGDFEFAVRYAKGEEKVCVRDQNTWLGKMCDYMHRKVL